MENQNSKNGIEEFQDRLCGLFIDLRKHYGAMLPDKWRNRPTEFYTFAAKLVGEIGVDAFKAARRATVAVLMIVAVIASQTVQARGVSTAGDWRTPRQSAKSCEFCERLAKSGRVLKGANKREWAKIKANHERGCPFCARSRKMAKNPANGGRR